MGLFLKEGELLKLQQTGKRPTLKAKDAPKVLGVSQGCEGCSLRQHWPQLLSAKMRMATTKEADILVLGEGPGEQEDLEGIPFVGRSGKFLRDVIPGRKLERLAWQNTVRCRPPANRNPTPGELHSCSIYLDEDIAALKPKAILGVGGVPLSRWRRPKDAGITDIHGIKFPVQIGGHNCWYYPIMHPSYLLRMGGEDSPAFPIFENDIKRFFRGVDKWPEANTYKLRPSDVTCAYTEVEARAVVEKLAEPIAVDIETPGLRPFRNGGKILTAAISDGVNTVAFPLNHPEAPNEWGWKLLAEVISSKRWIAHNAAFELTWFWFNMGQDWQPGPFEDTMALARIYYQRHNILSLSNLTFVLLGQDIKELSDIALDRVAEYPLSSVLPYNGLDALATILIYHQLKAKHLDEWQIDKILGAIKSVVRMELLGLPVDLREAADLHTHFDNLRQEAESKARELYEVRQFELTYQRRFNIGSGEDIGKALEEFGRLTLPKTDKKQIAKTDEAVLEGLNNPLAQQVLTYREAGKLCSTYLEGVLGGTLLGADGNLHPGYTTMFTRTLRLSSETPNIQNFPRRKHREIRRYIVAPKGHVLVPSDYGQIQVRIVAIASFDNVLIEQLLTGYDMHADWRNKLLELHPDFMLTVRERSGEIKETDLLKSARNIVKNQFVFASLFGSSAKSAAENLGIPLTVAQELNDLFWQTYRGVKKWHKAKRSEYRATGTTTSLTGRKRYQTLMGNESVNFPIQSSEADIVQTVQIELTELSLAERDPYLMPRINVHDDLTFILPDDSRLEGYIRRIGNIMVKRRFDFLIVPLVVEVSVGYNWADVSEVTKITGDYYK